MKLEASKYHFRAGSITSELKKVFVSVVVVSPQSVWPKRLLGKWTSILLVKTQCGGKWASWCLLRTWGSCLKIDTLCGCIRGRRQIIWKQCILSVFEPEDGGSPWTIFIWIEHSWNVHSLGLSVDMTTTATWGDDPHHNFIVTVYCRKSLYWLCYPRSCTMCLEIFSWCCYESFIFGW